VNFRELVVVFGGGALLGGLAWYLPGIWRHTNRRLDGQPDFWPYGELAWRGFARCIVPVWVVAVLGYGFIVFVVLAGRAAVPDWFAQAFVICAVAILLITVSVFLFNWPKLVVPPSLRSGPGVLEGLFARRRSTRSR